MSDIPNLPAANATTGIGLDTSRLTSRANLDKAGKQFEAVFNGMMLKSMRQAKLTDDDLFGSKAEDTFRDMSDTHLAQSMADHAPIGIGKALTDFLAKSKAGQQQGIDPNSGNAPGTAPTAAPAAALNSGGKTP